MYNKGEYSANYLQQTYLIDPSFIVKPLHRANLRPCTETSKMLVTKRVKTIIELITIAQTMHAFSPTLPQLILLSGDPILYRPLSALLSQYVLSITKKIFI